MQEAPLGGVMLGGSISTMIGVAAILVASVAAPIGAHAQAIKLNDSTSSLDQWLNQSSMLGGLASPILKPLEDDGITFSGDYYATEAANISGGKKQSNAYIQTAALGMLVDLGKVAGIKGGSISFVAMGRVGGVQINTSVGSAIDEQSNTGGGDDTRLADLHYRQWFDNHKTYVQIGYTSLGDNFGGYYLGTAAPGIAYFEGGGFNLHPSPTYRENGFETDPIVTLGGYIRHYFQPLSFFEIGAWDVKPDEVDAQNGWNLSLTHSTGAIIPVELQLSHSFGKSKLLGVYTFGGYYDTSTAPDVVTGAPVKGTLGGYFEAYQMVYRNQRNPIRSLALFFTVSGASSTNFEFPAFFNAGFVKTGTFPGRPYDLLDFGAYASMVNNRLLDKEQDVLARQGESTSLQTGEYGLDLAYGIRAAKWLYVSPNVEYIINPTAFSFEHFPNATVVGCDIVGRFL